MAKNKLYKKSSDLWHAYGSVMANDMASPLKREYQKNMLLLLCHKVLIQQIHCMWHKTVGDCHS